MKKLSELNRFYRAYLLLLCIFAVVRYVFPSVMDHNTVHQDEKVQEYSVSLIQAPRANESPQQGGRKEQVVPLPDEAKMALTQDVKQTVSQKSLLPLHQPTVFGSEKHRIYSVSGGYVDNFPDIQDIQYASASRWGIAPMRNRSELQKNKDKLVYVGTNPYIHLDERMHNSVPYLVPRASELLEHLGKVFLDSLYAKRIPLHKFIVSSVLRTEADVANLSRGNINATQRSCHMFGTTFDINYNRYYTVSSPDGPARREVRNDSLKMVLSEVLRDARNEGRCHVRYEIKQPCFHITVR